MKFVIDSEEISLPETSRQSFQQCCQNIMALLLEKERSIGSFKIDGKDVESIKDADQSFSQAQQVEVESLPLAEALQSALTGTINEIRKLETMCETLVTDCLLADPDNIAQQWQDLCKELTKLIGFFPSLGYLLTEKQINELIDQRYAEFNQIMKDIAEVLPKADVVAFSDILETRLQPWLKNMRDFSQEALQRAEIIK